jgi:hypothetical protein
MLYSTTCGRDCACRDVSQDKSEGIGLLFAAMKMTLVEKSAYNVHRVVAHRAHKLESTMEDTSL